MGWAWRAPLAGVTLAVVVVTTGAADAAVPSASPAATATPSATPSASATAAQLQSQAQREAGVLAAEQLAEQEAAVEAAAALEAYQAAQRRADEAARAYQVEASALRVAESRTAASRAALSRYLGSVYRTGVDFQPLGWQDLDPDEHGTFDLVHCHGVLYHELHPMAMLERLRSMVKPGGVFLMGSMMLAEPELSETARFVPGAF